MALEALRGSDPGTARRDRSELSIPSREASLNATVSTTKTPPPPPPPCCQRGLRGWCATNQKSHRLVRTQRHILVCQLSTHQTNTSRPNENSPPPAACITSPGPDYDAAHAPQPLPRKTWPHDHSRREGTYLRTGPSHTITSSQPNFAALARIVPRLTPHPAFAAKEKKKEMLSLRRTNDAVAFLSRRITAAGTPM